MQFNDKEKKILERITSFNKPVRSRIKRVYSSPKQKVKTETSAQTKKTMMLSILNNKNLKAGERLERVYKILGN